MPRFPKNSLLRHAFILLALLLAGLGSTSISGAGETDTQPPTKVTTHPQPQPQAQNQTQVQGQTPVKDGTKTKLQPVDRLPSLLYPRTGTGGVDNLGSIMSRDSARLRRSGRLNMRMNQNLRRLNNSIRNMRTNINRAFSIRRRPF